MKEGDSMEIGPLSTDPRLKADTGDKNAGEKETGTKGTAASSTQDSVRISDNARAQLAAVTADAYRQFGPRIDREDIRHNNEYLDAPRPLEKTMSSTEKIEILRERIEQGFYNRPEVKDEIARRLSDNGATPSNDTKDQGQTD
jgi:anti-sigma28 factor (negative regulator of flagellin synthesis)